MKSKLKSYSTKRLSLEYNKLLSSFAFNFNLRRYTKGFAASLVLLRSGWCQRVDFYGQPGVPERFKSTQQGGFEGGKAGGFGYHGRGAGGVAGPHTASRLQLNLTVCS